MEPKQTIDDDAERVEDGALSSLLIIGALLMLAGAAILGWFFLSSPGIIALKEVSMTELDAVSGFGINTEVALASWGLFVAPIMIITGAIFVAGGCIATAIYKR